MNTDVVIVGAGIVGMACAWAAKQRGHEVLVLEKDDQCVGASIRNFGFVTVTGQGRGTTWNRAMATRDIWARVAPEAGIQVLQQGLLVLAQRPEAADVLQALCRQPEGHALEWLDGATLACRYPRLGATHLQGALYSPHELRIESRQAINQLKTWLESQGIAFKNRVTANVLPDGRLFADGQQVVYQHLVIAPGPALAAFAPELVAKHAVRTCRLSMLRVRPPTGYVLPAPVMSDLSLVRYRGYAELPSSQALMSRLQTEQPEHLAHGVHLIAVQSADGSLVIGDSHHYGGTVGPFVDAHTEALILQEMQTVLRLPSYEVIERWVGYYPSGAQDAVIESLRSNVSVVSVTSGTGMSTSFALAQEWAEGAL